MLNVTFTNVERIAQVSMLCTFIQARTAIHVSIEYAFAHSVTLLWHTLTCDSFTLRVHKQWILIATSSAISHLFHKVTHNGASALYSFFYKDYCAVFGWEREMEINSRHVFHPFTHTVYISFWIHIRFGEFDVCFYLCYSLLTHNLCVLLLIFFSFTHSFLSRGCGALVHDMRIR